MCRQVTCKNCGKTTWAGCGQHVDAVMSKVPKAQQCTCERSQQPAAGSGSGSVFSRLFGR